MECFVDLPIAPFITMAWAFFGFLGFVSLLGGGGEAMMLELGY